MFEILNKINNPNDIKDIEPNQYDKLAKEIRRFLITKVSQTGGHLASNLGVVELTMALHLFLNFPEDKLIWDVGHQSYTHKLLTGRKNLFDSLRTFEGLSGFPKTKESSCDAFDTGHSSTSVSLALGFTKARDLQLKNNKVVAVIGDGALSGGMAYEALNNAARLKSNMIIVLNDNDMSISKNVGGMSNYLGNLRTTESYIGLKSGIERILSNIPNVGNTLVKKIRKSKDSIKHLLIPGMLFEDMGITYIGPIDGHNITQMLEAFHNAKRKKSAVLIHVITKKGKGYALAEQNPSKFHGVNPFDIKTGSSINIKTGTTYTEVFSNEMVNIAKENNKVVAITAAMSSGTGLEEFQKLYPHRFFDVGIAEEHGVTFAAGMAADGIKPVVAIYSSFLQRAYDQILHDVCIQKLSVLFAIDRSGIVGSDGETHQGTFDISYLSNIPNMTIISPKNGIELSAMLKFGIDFNGPIAIKYPRGEVNTELDEFNMPIEPFKCEMIYEEKDILLIAVGDMVNIANTVRALLKEDGFRNISLMNVRFIKPFDEEKLKELSTSHSIFITIEDNVIIGSFGQIISSFICTNKLNVELLNFSVPDEYIQHGDVNILRDKIGLSPQKIFDRIVAEYGGHFERET